MGSAASPLNPRVGALANNGGPTQTHALLAGSPAIDAGDSSYFPGNDQRGAGFPRVRGGRLDIGAFESVGQATSLSLNIRTTARAGSPQDVIVTALDASGVVASGYSGTVHFSSSDAAAILPSDTTFTQPTAALARFA